MEELLWAKSAQRLRQKEEWTVNEKGEVTIRRSAVVDPLFEQIKATAEQSTRRSKAGRYIGSIDPITAANWSRECGFAIGTKGFNDYAVRKIYERDFAKFRAEVTEGKLYGVR